MSDLIEALKNAFSPAVNMTECRRLTAQKIIAESEKIIAENENRVKQLTQQNEKLKQSLSFWHEQAGTGQTQKDATSKEQPFLSALNAMENSASKMSQLVAKMLKKIADVPVSLATLLANANDTTPSCILDHSPYARNDLYCEEGEWRIYVGFDSDFGRFYVIPLKGKKTPIACTDDNLVYQIQLKTDYIQAEPMQYNILRNSLSKIDSSDEILAATVTTVAEKTREILENANLTAVVKSNKLTTEATKGLTF